MRNLLILLAITAPSAVSAQTFVVGTNPADLPNPVYNAQQVQPVPAPVYNGQPVPMPHPAQSGVPYPVQHGSPYAVPAPTYAPPPIPNPVYNGGYYTQPQTGSVPYPVNNGGGFTIPAPVSNGSTFVPMGGSLPDPVQGVPAPQFSFPSPVQGSTNYPGYGYQGEVAQRTQEEIYRDEVDTYRAVGQVSPVAQTYIPSGPPAQTYMPSGSGQRFTIAPTPQVVYVPQAQPTYVTPSSQSRFTIPQQYQGNRASTYTTDVIGAVNYTAGATKDKIALDYIYRDSVRRGWTGLANTAKFLGGKALGIIGFGLDYGTACAPVSADSCR